MLRLLIHLWHGIVKELAQKSTDHILLSKSISVYEVVGSDDCETIYAAEYKRIRLELIRWMKAEYKKVKAAGSQVNAFHFYASLLSQTHINSDALTFGCPKRFSYGVTAKSKKKPRFKHSRDAVLRLNDETHKERNDRYYDSDPMAYYWNRLAEELHDRGTTVSQDYMNKSINKRRQQRKENRNAYQGYKVK